MHALLVTVDIDATRGDEARKLLDEFTVPAAKSLPGFVRGVWMRADDGSSGRGIVVVDTAENARAAAEVVKQGPPSGGPVTLRTVELFEVLAEA